MWRAACRAARRLRDIVAECNHAQRRLTQLRLDPDRYALNGDTAPASYGEFLFRSSGPAWREPAAGQRATGAQVRPVASRGASQRG
ncbi:MAG TPA: hypothetical protein DHU96_01210 [Actinobacteria bacterium]|nr:hypothetical protein [Actinomycetota bacterium]